MNELVSVIMTVYNEPITMLKESVESILKQSYPNIEFIVVLDNSGYEEAEVYLSSVKKIKLIKNRSNLGLAKSLNKGISYATGNIIARMDADDISEKDRIKKEYECMKKYDVDMVCTDISWIDEKGKTIPCQYRLPINMNYIKKLLRYTNCLVHPTYMFKREMFDSIGGYKESLITSQDYEFVCNLVNLGGQIYPLDEILLKYRIRANSISAQKRKLQLFFALYIRKMYKIKQNINEQVILDIRNNKNKAFQKFSNLYDSYNNIIKGKSKFLIFIIKILYSIKSQYFRRIFIDVIMSKYILRKMK